MEFIVCRNFTNINPQHIARIKYKEYEYHNNTKSFAVIAEMDDYKTEYTIWESENKEEILKMFTEGSYKKINV